MLAHIGHMPSALIAFCAAQGIVTEAYSPIAHGEAVKDPTVAAVAEKAGVSAAQLCIKYVLLRAAARARRPAEGLVPRPYPR